MGHISYKGLLKRQVRFHQLCPYNYIYTSHVSFLYLKINSSVFSTVTGTFVCFKTFILKGLQLMAVTAVT